MKQILWGPKRSPTPTKLGVPGNFFINFLPKCWGSLTRPGPPLGLLDPGSQVRRCPTSPSSYYRRIIPLPYEWPWLQKDVEPRSFWIGILGLKRWPTPTKLGVPCNFWFIIFSQNARLRLQRHPGSPIGTPDCGVGGTGSSPKNLPALKVHLRTKFHCNLSSSLDFHR